MSLHIENIHAGYGKANVLDDVSLQVNQGCICALMGRNGSGKTTLMRCINAMLKPSRGRVTTMGLDITRLSRLEIARLVSIVPQSSDTAFPFSSMEMILMSCANRIKAWSAPSSREHARARLVLDELEIGHLSDRPFNQLSGGERQLVMLARALFQDTPVMLLDEPNAHLDFAHQHAIMELMRGVVKKRGVTVLIILHDPNLVLYYCDRVAMMKKGRIVTEGPTVDVMNDRVLREVLGNGIQMEVTRKGRRVVTPRARVTKNISLLPDADQESEPCDVRTANGTVS